MATPEEIRGWIDALNRAIAQGVQSVSYDGRTITYRSLEEMKQVRADLEGQEAAAAGTPKEHTKFAWHRRGY